MKKSKREKLLNKVNLMTPIEKIRKIKRRRKRRQRENIRIQRGRITKAMTQAIGKHQRRKQNE